MEKVKLEICCGTACYLLGASRLIELEAALPADLRDRVTFAARPCLGLCNDDRLGSAPYVCFNGSEPMANATPDAVITRLRELTGTEGR